MAVTIEISLLSGRRALVRARLDDTWQFWVSGLTVELCLVLIACLQ